MIAIVEDSNFVLVRVSKELASDRVVESLQQLHVIVQPSFSAFFAGRNMTENVHKLIPLLGLQQLISQPRQLVALIAWIVQLPEVLT